MRRCSFLVFASAIAILSSASQIVSARDTYKHWDGSANIFPFGCPNTTTYGEVIKAPTTGRTLHKFSFAMQNYYNPGGSLVLRAEVYAWNGSQATGDALYESAPTTISFTGTKFHKVSFEPAVGVTPGSDYVLFLSIDKDFGECTSELDWGAVSARQNQHGGSFVYQNNGGDYENWTTAPWTHDRTIDLAFAAYIGP
jgi:hypothetical protein